MNKLFHIITDGSCDLPPEWAEQKGYSVVPFYVSFDDEHYCKEIEEIGIRDFYQQMVDRKGVYPKSSMPSTQDYVDAFMPWVEQDLPVICICITTKFSGSMQSAMNALQIIREEKPQARIQIIDSTVNTVLQGILVLEVVKCQESGMTYEETIRKIEEIKSTGRIFFTVGDMEYLAHGGRIGKVSSVAGSLLGIKPVITLKQGEIFPSGIGRSRRKNLDKTISLLLAYLKESGEDVSRFSIAVGYGYDYQEAVDYRRQVAEALEGRLKEEDIPLLQIGATISVHTGPYPLGLGIIRKAV
ncbi:MAG: DegV family protein [Lachnospiraceae bacterium]|nr:DegV family protein [Lachnospiraceae bacterium]